MEFLKGVKLERALGNTVTRYIRARYSRYNMEHHYRELLTHALRELKNFGTSIIISRTIITEGLRLNIITKQVAS